MTPEPNPAPLIPIAVPMPNTAGAEQVVQILDCLLDRVVYNMHDLGELGKFVRVEYLANFIADAKTMAKTLTGEPNTDDTSRRRVTEDQLAAWRDPATYPGFRGVLMLLDEIEESRRRDAAAPYGVPLPDPDGTRGSGDPFWSVANNGTVSTVPTYNRKRPTEDDCVSVFWPTERCPNWTVAEGQALAAAILAACAAAEAEGQAR